MIFSHSSPSSFHRLLRLTLQLVTHTTLACVHIRHTYMYSHRESDPNSHPPSTVSINKLAIMDRRYSWKVTPVLDSLPGRAEHHAITSRVTLSRHAVTGARVTSGQSRDFESRSAAVLPAVADREYPVNFDECLNIVSASAGVPSHDNRVGEGTRHATSSAIR